VNYELRTTVHPELLSPVDLADISLSLESLGATPTNVQPFRPEGCLDPGLVADDLSA
jgi:pyruvate formate lyase activating enzyme